MAALRFLRALPSVAVGALVVVAAAAQSDPSSRLRRLIPDPRSTPAKATGAVPGHAAAAREGASPSAANATTCRAVTATATVVRPPLATVWQPDAVTSTATNLSFGLASGSGAAATFTAELAFFDPSAPDPRLASYPLHRATLTAGGSGLETIACPVDRPIVIRHLDGGGVTVTAALALRSDSPDPVEDAIEPDGPQDLRAALYEAGALGLVPMPGPHPVLAHEVCGEMDPGDGLHVVRQVFVSNTTRTADLELVQTFSAPVTATAEWVELAVASPPGSPAPLEVRILDLGGGTVPTWDVLPVTTTAALMEGATLSPPVWGATLALAQPARLEAGRRYALAVVCDGSWSFGAAQAPGGTAYDGGELYKRGTPGTSLEYDADADLSFRVIGRPVTQTADPEWPVCDAALARAVTVTASFPVPDGRVVVQPLTIKGGDFGIGGASLRIVTPFTEVTDLDVDFALAPFGSPPAPNQIALRAALPISPCACPVGDLKDVLFTAPLVTTPLPGVAQGEGQQVVMSLRGRNSTLTAEAGYDEASTLPIPPAMFSDPGLNWMPLPGPNPVVAHVVCPATPTATGPWRVAQQLLQSNGAFAGTATARLLQSFRVPSTVQVSWAELGLRGPGGVTTTPVLVGLRVPGPSTQTVEPDIELGAMAVNATLTATSSGGLASLHPSSPLPGLVTLTAGVDYWIQVTTTADADYAYAEGSSYTEGRLFRSSAPGAPPVEETDRDLAFRLIGVPRELMAVPATPTCNGCFERAFDAVTVTADFRAVTFTAREFGQVLPVTTTPVLESMQLPLGADGGAVTITADVRLTGLDALGVVRPRDDTYPLHTVTITASAGDMRWGQAFFDRPLVVRDWVGSAPTSTAHLGLLVHAPDAGAKGRPKIALGAAEVCTCTALDERIAGGGGGGGGGGGWSPLPGLAMGHVLHGVTTTADLDLHQMVGELDVHGVTITASDLVQSFRVPTPTRVEWIELAVPEGQSESPPFDVSIVDPAGLAVPPAGPLRVTTTAVPFGFSESMRHGGTWAPTSRIAAPLVLQPGRDYWVVARVPATWHVARAVTATASVPGTLFLRPPGDGGWTEEPSGALAFRLIGAPANPVDVPVAAISRGLRLSASPMPFSHELSLRWLGGSGRMTVEVFDERGRRVRLVRDAGAAVYGAWTWRGEDDTGRRVGAGVYFVRATPGSGPAARQRVVFLR